MVSAGLGARPPPRATATRAAGRPARLGAPPPALPPHVLPAGPDFHYGGPRPLPFVGHELAPELSSQVKATIAAAAALPAEDYPHWWALFPSSVPSTVAATWGAMLWCAAAPVFDSRLDEQLLGLWSPYRARPLPRLDGPRWLTPPPLEALVGLYAERLRSGRVDAAIVVLRTLWAVANALRGDQRFQARADALLAILGATLNNPTIDYGTLPYGDLALVRQDVVSKVVPWLDPEIRYTIQAILRQSGHPLRALWPKDLRLPDMLCGGLGAGDAGDAAAARNRGVFLATMYAADLSWCRLGGGIPARPRGFPVPTAAIAEIIGTDRAKAASSAQPITPPPGLAPMGQQYPPGSGAQALPPFPATPAVPTAPPMESARPMPPVGPAEQPMGFPSPPGTPRGGHPGPPGQPEPVRPPEPVGYAAAQGGPETWEAAAEPHGPPQYGAAPGAGRAGDGWAGAQPGEPPGEPQPGDAQPRPEQPPVPGPPPSEATAPDVPESADAAPGMAAGGARPAPPRPPGAPIP